jgi:hypothetical protein
VQPAEAIRRALARHLRTLREGHWPGLRVTQQQLAEAFGDSQPLSVSLISSWESLRDPVAPPAHRLEQYAIFFATRRSVAGARARLLDITELTPEEGAEYDRLHTELIRLRNPEKAVTRLQLAAPGDEIGGGPFHFPDQKPVTIVCANLPPDMRRKMPYTDPRDPDYVRAHTYADLDSLIELHGHIRAVNPTVAVNIRSVDGLEEDDYTAHLVLLGGVDWNRVTRDIVRREPLPVRPGFRSGDDTYNGFFEVVIGEHKDRTFAPVLEDDEDGRLVLREDVAHVFRGTNPYNRLRTLTLCNGMFNRGTYGAVRGLTDARFRDRNERFLVERFGGYERFSILVRVLIAPKGEAVTPDWTLAENRLHEWPAMRGGDDSVPD